MKAPKKLTVQVAQSGGANAIDETKMQAQKDMITVISHEGMDGKINIQAGSIEVRFKNAKIVK